MVAEVVAVDVRLMDAVVVSVLDAVRLTLVVALALADVLAELDAELDGVALTLVLAVDVTEDDAVDIIVVDGDVWSHAASSPVASRSIAALRSCIISVQATASTLR